jgi:hypothetical protein
VGRSRAKPLRSNAARRRVGGGAGAALSPCEGLRRSRELGPLPLPAPRSPDRAAGHRRRAGRMRAIGPSSRAWARSWPAHVHVSSPRSRPPRRQRHRSDSRWLARRGPGGHRRADGVGGWRGDHDSRECVPGGGRRNLRGGRSAPQGVRSRRVRYEARVGPLAPGAYGIVVGWFDPRTHLIEVRREPLHVEVGFSGKDERRTGSA